MEFWISAYDPLNPEGIFIPEIETAIVSSCLLGQLPMTISPGSADRFNGGGKSGTAGAKKNIIAIYTSRFPVATRKLPLFARGRKAQ